MVARRLDLLQIQTSYFILKLIVVFFACFVICVCISWTEDDMCVCLKVAIQNFGSITVGKSDLWKISVLFYFQVDCFVLWFFCSVCLPLGWPDRCYFAPMLLVTAFCYVVFSGELQLLQVLPSTTKIEKVFSKNKANFLKASYCCQVTCAVTQ